MDSYAQRVPRALWSFWVACGLAASGAIIPLVLAAGGPNRIAGAVIPFAIGAAAMAVCALTYQRGRPLATSLYFLAGIALVYGMLAMVAAPVRLAVVGTCTPAAAPCAPGLEQPFSSGESAGLAFGIAMGTLAILVGFFGLLMLYRSRPRIVASPPPTRRSSTSAAPADPVVAPAAATAASEPASASIAAEPALPPQTASAAPSPSPPASTHAPSPKPARKPRAKRETEPKPELTAPASPLELEAPEAPLELPAPSSPADQGPGEPSSN